MPALPPPKRFTRWKHFPESVAVLEAALIGLMSGLSAVVLRWGIGWLGGMRVYFSYQLPAWLVLPGIGLLGCWIAGWLITRYAPEVMGSGILQVKAVLADQPMAMTLRVALVKLMSTMLTLGAGLPLGRQGPTIQISAALATQVSRFFPSTTGSKRQLMAAGAGAGLAAAFNTPLTGVLFVVEELLQDFSSLTLGTAILSSFVGAVVARLLGAPGLDINLVSRSPEIQFSALEIPFYIGLGTLAGLIGALFNRAIIMSLKLNRSILQGQLGLGLPGRMGLAGLISGLVIVLLPDSFRDHTGLRELLTTGDVNWRLAAIALAIHALLTPLAYGTGAPGGLFAPTLILGACLGYFVGIAAQASVGAASLMPYALVGMGALFSATIRTPITAIAIIFEMTANFNLILPLMVGIVIAYLVAELLSPGSLYNCLLSLSGIDLEESPAIAKRPFSSLLAADVMQSPVETLNSKLAVGEVMRIFDRSMYSGFPVVTAGNLVGIVTQADLSRLDPQRLCNSPSPMMLSEIMTPTPQTVQTETVLSEVLALFERHKISHVPVMKGTRLVGMITHTDIIRLALESVRDPAS